MNEENKNVEKNVEEKKVEEKPKKKGLFDSLKSDVPKAKVIPFDKLDITTASEDDIIRSGLKYHTKADYTCYAIMALIVVMAFVPKILQKVIPKPITEIKKVVVYLQIL